MFLSSEVDKLIQINEYKKSIHILTIRMASTRLIMNDLDQYEDYMEFLQGDYSDHSMQLEYYEFMSECYWQMKRERVRLQCRLDQYRQNISEEIIRQIASFM